MIYYDFFEFYTLYTLNCIFQKKIYIWCESMINVIWIKYIFISTIPSCVTMLPIRKENQVDHSFVFGTSPAQNSLSVQQSAEYTYQHSIKTECTICFFILKTGDFHGTHKPSTRRTLGLFPKKNGEWSFSTSFAIFLETQICRQCDKTQKVRLLSRVKIVTEIVTYAPAHQRHDCPQAKGDSTAFV